MQFAGAAAGKPGKEQPAGCLLALLLHHHCLHQHAARGRRPACKATSPPRPAPPQPPACASTCTAVLQVPGG